MPRAKKRVAARAPGGVRVVVRCRPLLPHEQGTTSERIFLDTTSITVNDTVGEARQFTFDTVLPPEADQADSFAEVAPLVDHVLDGFHATVFAYGQTGSGKTYTMEGFQYRTVTSAHVDGSTSKSSAPDPISTPVEQHGVMLRTIQLLFDRAHERQGDTQGSHATRASLDALSDSAEVTCSGTTHKESPGARADGVEYSFRCSYYQIYNERITDLLRPASSAHKGTRHERARPSLGDRGVDDELRVRWHAGDVFKVENLFLYECDTADKMREALVSGVRQKVMGSHLMNAQSSRSHCVFTVYVERRQADTQQLLSRSELSLVDLAGSEKLKQLASDPSAALVRESIEINASLLALGKVIMALSTRASGKRSGSDGHVPYRDSKLTKLLKHALGGNSVTVMFACITPSDRYVEESVSTLLYAGRAKNIENVPRVNEDPTTVLVRQLRAEIEALKKELAYYRTLATDKISQQEHAVRYGLDDGALQLTGRNVQPGESTEVYDARMAASASSKAAQLADSLLAACDMLQKVMSVNGQLRDAFEVVKQDKQAAQQREVQLNAENLALRERIEMLESIALNPELYNAEDQQPNSSPSTDALSLGRGRGTTDLRSESSDPDTDTDERDRERGSSRYRASPVPPPAQQKRRGEQGATPSSRRARAGNREDSAVAPWDTSPLPPPPPPAPVTRAAATSSVPVHPAQAWAVESGATARTTAGTPTPQPPRRLPIRAPSPHFDTDEVASADAPAVKASKKKTKKKKKKKTKKVLVQRLKQYEQIYREPSHVQTYAEYYDKARATIPENPQHSAALRDMEETLKKLPRDVVLSVVPLSLRQPGAFGALSFGGTREDTHAFEEKRQQRVDRREELLRKQKELQDTLRQDVVHVQEVDREDTTAKGVGTRSVYASDPASTGPSATSSKSKSGASKRTSAMPTLAPTAAASSLNSVDRLRAYLDKDKQQQPPQQTLPQAAASYQTVPLARLNTPQTSRPAPDGKATSTHMYNEF